MIKMSCPNSPNKVHQFAGGECIWCGLVESLEEEKIAEKALPDERIKLRKFREEVTSTIMDTEEGLIKKPASGIDLLNVKAEAYNKIRTIVGRY